MSEALLLVSLAGLGAGVAHVYLGVDHLAALVPISHGRSLRAFWLGLRWGLGHSIGVLVVAMVLLLFREIANQVINIEAVSAFSEQLVGIMLILMGAYGVRLALKQTVHTHQHQHDGHQHEHLHVHLDPPKAEPLQDHLKAQSQHHNTVFHGHAAIAAGLLHGFAGMAHLFGVLPTLALALESALLYLVAFALGSTLGMGAFAAGYGLLSASIEDAAPRMIRYSRLAASGFCLVVGFAWSFMTIPL